MTAIPPKTFVPSYTCLFLSAFACKVLLLGITINSLWSGWYWKKHFSESFDTPDTSSQSTVVWKKNFETLPSTHLWLLSLQIRSFLRTLLAYFFPLSPAKFFSLGLPSIVYEGCRIQKRCLVVRMKEAQARVSQAKPSQAGRKESKKKELFDWSLCLLSSSARYAAASDAMPPHSRL